MQDGTLLRLLKGFWRQPAATAEEIESERAQFWIRIAASTLASAYTVLFGYLLAPSDHMEPWARTVLVYFGYYALLALVFYLFTLRFPGNYPFRRVGGMVLDYSFSVLAIVTESTVMMPVFAVIVWVTLGNGLRFGSRYLVIGTIMALVSIAVTTYWRESLSLPITMALTAIAIPVYAHALLGRVEQARSAAEAASRAKTRLLAQASHDLRQPLHAMGLFIASLRQTRLTGSQKAILDRVDRSLHGVSHLFRSLLDLSMLDSGTLSPVMAPVHLGELLQDVFQQNAETARWDGTRMRVVEAQGWVLADHALLSTMIQNLVSNALKFSAGRSVLVGVRRQGSHRCVQVVDKGDGIAAEHLPHLFEEFFQVRQRGDADHQGVGLGLSIVKRLADQMALTLAITSTPGRGTIASIGNLKLARAPAALPSPLRSPGSRSPLNGLRILLIEDDRDVLAATHDLLSSWGCRVSACSGIPDVPPDCDLILTDFDLGGGVTGGDCIAQVRQHWGREVPAIVMTGHDEHRIGEEIAGLGAPLLKKPVRPAELRSLISSMFFQPQE